MKIGICSDLHLEFGARDFDFPEADILVLAGDILLARDLREDWEFSSKRVAAREFIRDASLTYPKVLWIPGNHEYYDGNIDTADSHINAFLKLEGLENVTYAEAGAMDFEGITFIYATLWTDINRANPMVITQSNMADYREIMCYADTKSGGRYLTPEDTMRIHKGHKTHITNELIDTLEKVVVVTHHAPTLMSCEEAIPTMSDYYYCCTDMEDLILDNPKIKLWIHGHLHTRNSHCVGDTQVISNCRGYVGHESATETFKIQVIEV